MNLDIDVRPALRAIRVPTLVLQRRDELFVGREVGRYVAEQISGAVYEELPGADFLPWAGDRDAILEHARRFLERVWEDRGWEASVRDRVLATVLFTDVADATEKAVELGDARWRELVKDHHALVRTQLVRFRGNEIDTAGTDSLPASMGRRARFGARARS